MISDYQMKIELMRYYFLLYIILHIYILFHTRVKNGLYVKKKIFNLNCFFFSMS